MAVLRKYIINNPFDTTGLNLPLAPAGTYVALVIDIKDSFGVMRPVYGDPTKTEIRDVTRWTFAFKNNSGQTFLVQTTDMRISAHEKASLTRFLTAIHGAPYPPDVDYVQEEGRICQITVVHQTSKSGNVYARITNVAPAHASLVALAPTLEEGKQLFSYYEQLTHQGGLGSAIQRQMLPARQPAQAKTSTVPVPSTLPPWPLSTQPVPVRAATPLPVAHLGSTAATNNPAGPGAVNPLPDEPMDVGF